MLNENYLLGRRIRSPFGYDLWAVGESEAESWWFKRYWDTEHV